MSLIDRTERVAERLGANHKPVYIVFAEDHETKEQAWARCHPETPLPSDEAGHVVVVMWL